MKSTSHHNLLTTSTLGGNKQQQMKQNKRLSSNKNTSKKVTPVTTSRQQNLNSTATATTSFNSNKENQFGHKSTTNQKTSKQKQDNSSITQLNNDVLKQPQHIQMTVQKFDPKESPNPTTFSNQRSQIYMSNSTTTNNSGCHSVLSQSTSQEQQQKHENNNVNDNNSSQKIGSSNYLQINGNYKNGIMLSPNHKSSTMINPVTLGSNVSDFKNQVMQTTMDHQFSNNVNNQINNDNQDQNQQQQPQQYQQSQIQQPQNSIKIQKFDTISDEDYSVKVLALDEVNSIDEEATSSRPPIQLPQTQFQNIFKTKRMSCEDQPQMKQTLLNSTNGSNLLGQSSGKIKEYTLKNSDTLDKQQSLTQNNWIQSTLACTLQVNTRNNHASINNNRVMFSTKAPFDMTMTTISPQSKNAQFHKLENKILLTQIEDGDDCECDIASSRQNTHNTIRQSLNSTLQISNSQLQERLSHLQQRLNNPQGDHQNQFTTESGMDTNPTSSGVVCSCVTSLDGQTNQTCSQCNCHTNQSQSHNNVNKQKFMINLEAVLFEEIKLWTMIQSLEQINPNTLQELMILCEEWWEVTKDSTCLFDIYKIYRDQHTRKTIRKALIFECISVVIAAFIVQNKSTNSLKSQFKSLKKVLILAHQNFIHIICYVLHRMGLENIDQNVWALALKDIIFQKSKIKGEEILLMNEETRNFEINNNNEKILKSFISINKRCCKGQDDSSGKVLFNTVNVILNDIEKIHINRVKDNMIKALNHQATLNIQTQHQQQQQQHHLQQQQFYNLQQNHQDYNNNNQYNDVIMHQAANDYDLMQQLQAAIEYHYGPPEDSYQLPVVVEPFLPKQQMPRYTLVLDLDETLIHYIESINDPDLMNPIGESQIGTFLIRPGAQEFLREMSQYYELVIFTAGMQDYADWVLDQLDPHRYISYRLYRQHTQANGQCHIKDLSKIGRDLSKTLIVDNVAENFQLQPENGIFIKTWTDDPTDNALEELAPLLKQIVQKQIPDVREALRIFRIQMTEQIQRGIEKPKLNLH